MAREKSNPLGIRIEKITLPASMTPKRYLLRLLNSVENMRPLPPNWSVNLYWRNRETKVGKTASWQVGEFFDVLQDSESNGGFNEIVRGFIEKAIAKRPARPAHTPKKKVRHKAKSKRVESKAKKGRSGKRRLLRKVRKDHR